MARMLRANHRVKVLPWYYTDFSGDARARGKDHLVEEWVDDMDKAAEWRATFHYLTQSLPPQTLAWVIEERGLREEYELLTGLTLPRTDGRTPE